MSVVTEQRHLTSAFCVVILPVNITKITAQILSLICTICTNVTGCLCATPAGAAQPWKPMPRSSRCTVSVLMFMPQASFGAALHISPSFSCGKIHCLQLLWWSVSLFCYNILWAQKWYLGKLGQVSMRTVDIAVITLSISSCNDQ